MGLDGQCAAREYGPAIAVGDLCRMQARFGRQWAVDCSDRNRTYAMGLAAVVNGKGGGKCRVLRVRNIVNLTSWWRRKLGRTRVLPLPCISYFVVAYAEEFIILQNITACFEDILDQPGEADHTFFLHSLDFAWRHGNLVHVMENCPILLFTRWEKSDVPSLNALGTPCLTPYQNCVAAALRSSCTWSSVHCIYSCIAPLKRPVCKATARLINGECVCCITCTSVCQLLCSGWSLVSLRMKVQTWGMKLYDILLWCLVLLTLTFTLISSWAEVFLYDKDSLFLFFSLRSECPRL